MLKPKFATLCSFKSACTHCLFLNLAIDLRQHVFRSDCFSISFLHCSRQVVLPGLFPCFPTHTDFPSCFLHFQNRIHPPHSSSAQWEYGDENRLPWALQAHFYTLLPSCSPSDAISRPPAFTCWGTDAAKPQRWSRWQHSRLGSLLPPRLFGHQQLAARGSKFRAVCPCFSRCCYHLNGFHCAWKTTDCAVITSLLAQEPRRLCYLSGYWVSAERRPKNLAYLLEV